MYSMNRLARAGLFYFRACRLARDASVEPDMDVFRLREPDQLVEALLAARAGLLEPAKRRREEVATHFVDPHVARFDFLGRPQGGGNVIGPDGAGQPVLQRVDLRDE